MAINKIYINIAGRKYPVKLEGEEKEEVIREIEKNINKKINEFVRTYEYKDKLDIITLILLNCSHDFYKIKHDEQKLINKISEIENVIDQIL